MLSKTVHRSRVSLSSAATLVLIGSILGGVLLGHFYPSTGQQLSGLVDPALLLLVSVLFFGVRLEKLMHASSNWRFIIIALVANFVIVPIIGYAIATLFLFEHPLLLVGLVIYFMAPCTDWFLGFTRISGGNVALGTTLLPLNMALQLLLYPFYLQLFTQHVVELNITILASGLWNWFVLPLTLAVLLHQVLRKLLSPSHFECILHRADQITPWLIGLLVFLIFAANVNIIMDHYAVFAWMLVAIFTFFLLTYLLSEGLAYLFRMNYPDRALLTMTIAARNAPLMLAVTMIAIPEQPLIYAALVIGMLLEFPHLTALQHILLNTRHHSLHQRHPSTL